MFVYNLDIYVVYNCWFQDMQEMRERYDRLLSVAAATANSAYGKIHILSTFCWCFYNFLSSTLVHSPTLIYVLDSKSFLFYLSEFSESLGEMGSCLEQISPHNDEESGKSVFFFFLEDSSVMDGCFVLSCFTCCNIVSFFWR